MAPAVPARKRCGARRFRRPETVNIHDGAIAVLHRGDPGRLSTPDLDALGRVAIVMNGIAKALSVKDSADVASYFAGRPGGCKPGAPAFGAAPHPLHRKPAVGLRSRHAPE